MLYTYAARFDVMGNLKKKFRFWLWICLVLKKFQNFPSHRISEDMNETLNIN